eukprot:scaffold425_cov175-Amphora_coffeaeformis.AAC.63
MSYQYHRIESSEGLLWFFTVSCFASGVCESRFNCDRQDLHVPHPGHVESTSVADDAKTQRVCCFCVDYGRRTANQQSSPLLQKGQ